jgi:hypothetical protein
LLPVATHGHFTSDGIKCRGNQLTRKSRNKQTKDKQKNTG